MVSTHVGVSLWYDAHTIVHCIDGAVLLCGHYWLDCGTGQTCLQLKPIILDWLFSTWAEASLLLEMSYNTAYGIWEGEITWFGVSCRWVYVMQYLHSYRSHCGLFLMKKESISNSNAVTRGLLCFNQWNKRLFHCCTMSMPCPLEIIKNTCAD